MKVVNIHTRIIACPQHMVSRMLQTLGTEEDQMWPVGKWPRMKFKDRMEIGALGGHGPIMYRIKSKIPGKAIVFQFVAPEGFHGAHGFNIEGILDNKTKITHIIEMNTSILGYLQWVLAIRWLNDALIEDAFDKIEQQATNSYKKSQWTVWVKFLRFIFK